VGEFGGDPGKDLALVGEEGILELVVGIHIGRPPLNLIKLTVIKFILILLAKE